MQVIKKHRQRYTTGYEYFIKNRNSFSIHRQEVTQSAKHWIFSKKA